MSEPRHEITDLTSAAGELSFQARIDGGAMRVWFRTETPVVPPADAALAACLIPAMASGGSLAVSQPVSPRILRTQREYQAIQRAWSLDWDYGAEPLLEVDVQAPPRGPAERPEGRVAAFFSGGVDSWSTVLANPDVTDLIFVHGFDLIPGMPHHAGLGDEVEARLREAAAAVDLRLHVVETNLREFSDPLARWEVYNGTALAAAALLFESIFERVLIASDTDHQMQVPVGTARMVDQLWSSEGLEIVDDGGRFSREQRLRLIAEHPVVQRTLRVCWENLGGAYNCGRCRKCLMTMVSLEALGLRDRFATFPAELDLARLDDFEIVQPISLTLWEDVLDTVRAAGRSDLEHAVAPMVAGGKVALGLPDSYRGRKATGLAAALRDAAQRTALAEAREAEARRQLDIVLSSSSWRLTAPLRQLAGRRRKRPTQ
jgi:hypothetical protein